VLHVDRFGNLLADLVPAFADAILADAPALLRDSSGYLAIVVRDASAAALREAARGTEVLIRGLR
jgi:hypothetical protein